MKKKFYKEEELVFGEKSTHGRFEDLEGQRFNRLIVLGYVGAENKRTLWFCKCECGKIVRVEAGNVKNGHTTSCGCFHINCTKEGNSTHGHTIGYNETPTYKTWCGMIARCGNPNEPAYPNYGGRGITVCERWLIFENFLEDMGERPENTTIDRIWNDGNYEPGNCRWANRKEQANNRRSNILLTFHGKTQNISQWSDGTGISRGTIQYRIHNGWSVEKTLTTPVRK